MYERQRENHRHTTQFNLRGILAVILPSPELKRTRVLQYAII